MKNIKIHGVVGKEGRIERDAAYIEKVFDQHISHSKDNPAIKIMEIKPDLVFVQTEDGVFEAIPEGKGRSGNELFTLGKPIREVNELTLKEAKDEIKVIWDEKGELDDDDGTEYNNPFLPTIDELEEGNE